MDIFSQTATGRVIDRHLDKIFSENLEVLRFLKRHPHRSRLEENLTKQLRTVDARKALRKNPNAAKILDDSIHDIVKLWSKAMIDFQEKSQISQNERRRLEDANRQEEIAKDIVRDIAPNIDTEDDFDVKEL